MTKFQKCILVFIGEFLVLTGCLIAAVGAPDVGSQGSGSQPHKMVVGALIVAGLSLSTSLLIVFVFAIASTPPPVQMRYPHTPPQSAAPTDGLS